MYENEYAFAPSRFAGYPSNNQPKHERRENSDGKVTNPALNKIFGPPIDEKSDNLDLYKAIDEEFNNYCKHNNITPDSIPNPRKYWLTPDVYLFKTIIKSNDQKDQDDALDDIGADHPGTQAYAGVRYSRDPAIRAKVMIRAGGVCEYCNRRGFVRDNDEPYLECHHIIALAKDGADRMTNVVALCPNDHREAHFGKRRHKLEKEMIRNIKKIASRSG
jgi:hypothetical protein